MDIVLKDEVRHAKKVYMCDAYAWWNQCGMNLDDCVNEEQKLIVQASESDHGKILVGQLYRYQRGVFEGRMVTWRERFGMGNVCRNLGLYSE
jgi:hypothetical protein